MAKLITCALALFCLSPLPAAAQTLLYKNTCPAPSQSDPAYLAGVQAIRAAIDSGKTITMSMSLPQAGQISKFFVQFSAIKASSNYASGLILMRPPLNDEAQAIAGSALVVGSADTLGNYRYGTVGGTVGEYRCYENAWWAR